MKNRISFVDFLTRIKYHILVSIVIALLIVCSVLIYLYNTEKYNEKAVALLEKTTNNYEELVTRLQNSNESSDKNIEETDNKSNTSSHVENNITYETVLKALDEITEVYPKSFASQKALMQSGTILMYLKDYEKARDNFLAAAQKRRKTHITPIAYLHAAISQENIDLTSGTYSTQAQEYYQHIIDIYPKSIVAAHAYFSLGRLAEQQILTKSSNAQSSARSYYKTLIDSEQFRDSSWASLAQGRVVALDAEK